MGRRTRERDGVATAGSETEVGWPKSSILTPKPALSNTAVVRPDASTAVWSQWSRPEIRTVVTGSPPGFQDTVIANRHTKPMSREKRFICILCFFSVWRVMQTSRQTDRDRKREMRLSLSCVAPLGLNWADRQGDRQTDKLTERLRTNAG